jgi:hypothetical protein
MNLVEFQRKLIAAARSEPVNERVPYAFEKRVMARLAAEPAIDPVAAWARALWRAAAACAAITVLLGAWSLYEPSAGAPGTDLSEDFENTVLATAYAEPGGESVW